MLTTTLLFQLASPLALAAAAPPQGQPAAQHTAVVPQAPPPTEPNPRRLSWTFPRFRLWQYAAGVAVTGTNLYLQYGTGQFPDQRWNSPILFDEWARGIRADTEEGRQHVAVVSDYMWH